MTLVLNERGRPEPPSEIQRRLGQVHERLFLRHIEAADAVWAICMRWANTDARFGQVQSNVIDPERSFDIIGYLPKACGVSEAPAYLERAFQQYPVEEVRRVVERVSHFNRGVVSEAADAVLGEVLDQADPSGVLPKITRPKRR